MKKLCYCIMALICLCSCAKENLDPFYERTFQCNEDVAVRLTFHRDGTCTVGRWANTKYDEDINRNIKEIWTYTKDNYGNISFHSGKDETLGCKIMYYYRYAKYGTFLNNELKIVCSRVEYYSGAPLKDETLTFTIK